MSRIALDTELDLSKLLTNGSILHINEDDVEIEHYIEPKCMDTRKNKVLGEPVTSFEELIHDMTSVDSVGLVKKKILEEGGGLPIHKGCTVSVAYSGYFKGDLEPFDATKYDKPQVVNMQESGLLPGLEIAIESMLVGEIAVFLLNYNVMYGELGIPPRIKPKVDCVFYIKLIKSILTPEDRHLDYSEKNLFYKIHKDVKLLYASGNASYKINNFFGAAQSFRRGIAMLHNCRLADEAEEVKQQKLLVKMYLNQAICYNMIRQPLKACIACNELNRLNSLWNNGKALYQNAKALRMINQFDSAEKMLKKAKQLCPNNKLIEEELLLVNNIKQTCTKSELIENTSNIISDDFKKEVHDLIKDFKNNGNLCNLTLPEGLNDAEIDHVKDICKIENLFISQIDKDYLLNKEIVHY